MSLLINCRFTKYIQAETTAYTEQALYLRRERTAIEHHVIEFKSQLALHQNKSKYRPELLSFQVDSKERIASNKTDEAPFHTTT